MSHWYIAQTAQGNGDGLSAANAKAITFPNTSGNWGVGAGKINPGDTVHLVGTLSETLNVFGSGSSGNIITIFWETNSKISTPNSRGIYADGQTYITYDGGVNGIIECTDNGSELGHQTAVNGIQMSNCASITVKNLTIKNLYVHTLASDSSVDISTVAGVYANGYSSNILIQDCVFSNIGWCITAFGAPDGFLTVTRCDFSNYDHGIGGVAGNPGTVAGFTATYNHFGTTANWDTTANTYHHDGIHTYWGDGSGGIPNAIITNNIFDGDWGTHNTAHLFFEQNFNDHDPAEAPGWLIANNLHIQYPGDYLNNGFMVAIGDTAIIANNTYLGQGVLSGGAGTSAVNIRGINVTFKNNILTAFNTILNAQNFIANGLNNNIYAAITAGGNSPWVYNGTNYNSFAAWKAATGQDSSSLELTPVPVNSNGTVPLGSPAIGVGANMSAYFTVDITGSTRTIPWDIGAYKYMGQIATVLIKRLGRYLRLRGPSS